MFRKIAISAVSALALTTTIAFAAGEATHTEDVAFSFEGIFGSYDQMQLQRGLQVYTEVCSACHGLKFVPMRTLADEGGPNLPEDQVRAYATQFTITDKDTGEDRDGLPTDNFPANTSLGAPDLSLMAKARAGFSGPYGLGINQLVKGMGGAEHLYSTLVGYTGEEKTEFGETFYENISFPGGWIKMPPPLSEDQVAYEDGHPATVENMAEDVSAFLMWAAEPHLNARKQAGFKAVILLTLLASLLYLTNKRLWSRVKGPKTH
jgi:ubiquinol-cytochrome c reductase cytochrome c1 subunit